MTRYSFVPPASELPTFHPPIPRRIRSKQVPNLASSFPESSNTQSGINFTFSKRNERVDWRMVSALDIPSIVQSVDIRTLQPILSNVMYCDLASENQFGSACLDPGALKLFQASQLLLEYLIYCQGCLEDEKKELQLKVKHLVTENENLHKLAETEGSAHKSVEKELRNLKKSLYAYQVLAKVPGGIGSTDPTTTATYHRCPKCPKVFGNDAYLQAHISRRHEAAEIKPATPPPFIAAEKGKSTLEEFAALMGIVESFTSKRAQEEERLRSEMQRNLESRMEERQKALESTFMQEKLRYEQEMAKLHTALQVQLEHEQSLLQEQRTDLDARLQDLRKKEHIGNLEDEEDSSQKPIEHPDKISKALSLDTFESKQAIALQALRDQLAKEMQDMQLALKRDREEERKALEQRLNASPPQEPIIPAVKVSEQEEWKDLERFYSRHLQSNSFSLLPHQQSELEKARPLVEKEVDAQILKLGQQSGNNVARILATLEARSNAYSASHPLYKNTLAYFENKMDEKVYALDTIRAHSPLFILPAIKDEQEEDDNYDYQQIKSGHKSSTVHKHFSPETHLEDVLERVQRKVLMAERRLAEVSPLMPSLLDKIKGFFSPSSAKLPSPIKASELGNNSENGDYYTNSSVMFLKAPPSKPSKPTFDQNVPESELTEKHTQSQRSTAVDTDNETTVSSLDDYDHDEESYTEETETVEMVKRPKDGEFSNDGHKDVMVKRAKSPANAQAPLVNAPVSLSNNIVAAISSNSMSVVVAPNGSKGGRKNSTVSFHNQPLNSSASSSSQPINPADRPVNFIRKSSLKTNNSTNVSAVLLPAPNRIEEAEEISLNENAIQESVDDVIAQPHMTATVSLPSKKPSITFSDTEEDQDTESSIIVRKEFRELEVQPQAKASVPLAKSKLNDSANFSDLSDYDSDTERLKPKTELTRRKSAQDKPVIEQVFTRRKQVEESADFSDLSDTDLQTSLFKNGVDDRQTLKPGFANDMQTESISSASFLEESKRDLGAAPNKLISSIVSKTASTSKLHDPDEFDDLDVEFL